ncbi:MAG TPA: cytochrome c oxidase subunit II [Acidimicrobiales bacterium]|jgi:cytochrome c oxidase subunit 2
MTPRSRPSFAALVAAAGLLAACAGDDTPSMLDPSSGASRRVAGLWWMLFWLSVVAVAVVLGMIAVAIARRHRPEATAAEGTDDVDRSPVAWGDRFVVLSGIVVTGTVLAVSFVVSLFVLDDLAAPAARQPLKVDVIAHTWWWEVRYPGGAVTANEIHIPVGEPVEVRLRTADVIHSFWVPELQVKQDLVPGMDNHLSLEADHAGRFRGQCAEYCGLQHAHMVFFVRAQPPADFEQWLADQERPAAEPTSALARQGRTTFEGSSCAGCHTIRGTTADGELGPDLTHLAGRETIGAGIDRLDPDTLARWITNAQDAKPGAAMPPTELTPDEVDAVVAYLMGLK